MWKRTSSSFNLKLKFGILDHPRSGACLSIRNYRLEWMNVLTLDFYHNLRFRGISMVANLVLTIKFSSNRYPLQILGYFYDEYSIN